MARKQGFFAAMAQANREAERQRLAAYRAHEKAQMDAARARERSMKAAERARSADEKESRRIYLEARQEEAEALSAEVAAQRDALEGILAATLRVDDYIDLDSLKEKPYIPPFNPGTLATPTAAPRAETYQPAPLTFSQKLVPGAKAKFERAQAEGQARFASMTATWQAQEQKRGADLAAAQAGYLAEVERIKAGAAAQHAEIDKIKAELDAGHADSIRGYFEMVLVASAWPDGFPHRAVLAYDPSSKLMAVDYMLPDWSVVPEAKAYRYVKARDVIEPIDETAAKRRAMYASVIAQAALRIVHEVFEADRRGHVETLALNCHVDTIDRATDAQHTPCILSLRTTAATFKAINLAAVDPIACLKGLSAAMSPSPAELAPVRPVLELKMVDKRFIEETDVLSELDSRPNLMELTPSEFESLITNLFTKMGLEARLTQASRDGGVDCVAYDPRPIFGGKVVIQAKRYKNTVGVSAVRDLFGTMQNEGASKGILVTTSGYGAAAFQFAEGKPIELLTGANLLYLLAEHAGIEARIIPPEQWRDPVPDEEYAH
jgi:restriction system protein